MVDAYETGAIWAPQDNTTLTSYPSGLPKWQRDYYEGVLLETLRVKSILVPFCRVKEDFAALNTKTIHFSEVYDLEPNWNATSEQTIWKKGMYLDSRSISIGLNWYHDIIKYSDHLDVFTYLNGGDARGIVRDKLGVAMVDMLDILAMNAFFTHPNPLYGGDATSRITLAAGDTFDLNQCEEIRTQMEEDEVPGVASVEDGGAATILCVTTPRNLKNIRTAAGGDWLDVNNYQSTGAKFRSEVGSWAGIRFAKTNRLWLKNRGTIAKNTTLAADTEEGQGSAATVDTIYKPGQDHHDRFIELTALGTFVAGDYITIHSGSGTTVEDGDGTQETRRIVATGVGTGGTANSVSLNKPLLKAHSSGAKVVNGLDVHASIFLGGKGVVMGVAERPNVIVPPKFDDALLINRIGWRGLLKFQLFQPEVFRVMYNTAS